MNLLNDHIIARPLDLAQICATGRPLQIMFVMLVTKIGMGPAVADNDPHLLQSVAQR